ncbi:hypothetical protein APHAL10511_000098 [Amanita phalloides]|nr:hypothetical protein APHAL10511_000098 [Amanita phalloides]
MRAFVLALYLESTTGERDLMSSKGMRTMQMVKVAELLQIDLHVEEPHETLPGVTIGKLGGPLYELVKLITDVLNETGQLLVEYGYTNLGSFVIAALEEGKKAGEGGKEVVLERIVRAFPGFQDMAIVNGQHIYCFKKALFLIHAICIQFGSLKPAPFWVADTTDSPVFADNVLPSMMMHFGVIDVGRLGMGRDMNWEEGYMLRAAAIEAGERIATAAGRLETEVDMWLWGISKRPELRVIDRMAERGTVFY